MLDKYTLLSIAPTIDTATERTAKQHGISLAGLRFLSLLYSIEQSGRLPRASLFIRSKYYCRASVASRTNELRQAGYIIYRPKTRKALQVTTAGKLLLNEYAKEIQRQVERIATL